MLYIDESFPKPLSDPETDYYLRQFNNGNLKAKEILIERNLRLVVYIAKKYENTNIDPEDLISIGTIGLIKGINTFNIDKNIKLATYTSRCIENEMLMYIRRNLKHTKVLSLDEAIAIDGEGNELTLSNVLSNNEKDALYDYIKNEDRVEIRDALVILSKLEKKVIALRIKEMTQKDIAELLGVSQSYISRIERDVIRKLRKYFKKKGFIINSTDNKKQNRRCDVEHMSLLELFSEYSEEKVIEALNQLTNIERDMLLMRYPLGNEEYQIIRIIADKYNLSPSQALHRLNHIIMKVTFILEGKELPVIKRGPHKEKSNSLVQTSDIVQDIEHNNDQVLVKKINMIK